MGLKAFSVLLSLKWTFYEGIEPNVFQYCFISCLFFSANRCTETNGVFFVAVVLLVFANPLISQSRSLLLLRVFFPKYFPQCNVGQKQDKNHIGR